MPDKLPDDPSWVNDIDSELDKFEQEIAGLPIWKKVVAPEYLSITVDELRRKDPEQLNEALFVLNQYALNIQRLINRLRAWERWTYSSLDALEAFYISETDQYLGWQARSKQARNNPERCKKIGEFQRKIKMQLDRLNGLPEHVHKIAESIRDFKFLALKRERE